MYRVPSASIASAPGYPGRPETKLWQFLPPAVRSRASAAALHTQRFPRSATNSVLPSRLRASPEAPATPPSTFCTVRAAGSYTYTQPVPVWASSSVRRVLSSPSAALALAATAK